MAASMSTASINEPQIGQGGGSFHPPFADGGDGRGDNPSADYGSRLRRARLGMILALSGIMMLFIGFTSAMVIRKGLPMQDEATSKNVTDWLQVNLPVGLLIANTLLLVFSSLSLELARRQIARKVILAPVASIPGVSVGRERYFPWLG